MTAPVPGYRRLLGRVFVNRDVFFLWSGQVVSQAGDSVFNIGLLWLLLELTGSNALTGLIAMSAYLPTLIFGLYGGVLADRFDRRRLMLASDLARALVVAAIPLLHYKGVLNPALLGLCTFALATFAVVFVPARDALVGQLAPPSRLLRAHSSIQTSWQYAMLLGPAVAGLLVAVFDQIHLFSVDALSYLVSFLLIARIRPGKHPAERRTGARVGGQVWEGLRYAWGDRRIRVLLLVTAVDNLFLMGPAIVGIPIFVRQVLNQGVASYAFAQTAYALGMVAGTLLLNVWSRRTNYGRILLWGIFFDGMTFLPLWWIDTFWGLFVALAVHSAAIPLIVVSRPTLVQRLVPAHMQGRVFSMIAICVNGCTAVSVAVTGVVSEAVPINTVYAVIAVLAAASGGIGWLVRDFRES